MDDFGEQWPGEEHQDDTDTTVPDEAQYTAGGQWPGQEWPGTETKAAGDTEPQWPGQEWPGTEVKAGKPEAEGRLASDTRELAHSIVPAATGVVGAGAATSLAAPVIGAATAVNPLLGAATALGFGAAGMLGGAYLGEQAKDAVLKKGFGYDDDVIRAANREARPIETQIAGLLPFAGNPAATLAQRGVGAGMMTAFSGGQQLAHGEFDPKALAVDAAWGAAMPNGNRVTRALHEAGARLTGRPEATSDTIGNPQSSPERSERGYAKDAGETPPQGDMLTTGDVDPATAAALGAEQQPARPAEPAVPEGHTRLYRGETDIPGEFAGSELPDWLRENPDVQAMKDATGRWFTNTRENAEHYNKSQGANDGRVSYVDVPTGEVDQYNVRNQPEARRFTAAGREDEEFFVPREIADKKQSLAARAKEGEKVTGEVGGHYNPANVERLRIEQEQAKREQLLADPEALKAYAADKGISEAEMRELIQTNYDNGKIYLAELPPLEPGKPGPAMKWKDLSGEVGGQPPQEPPGSTPKEPLKPPPPEVKATKEDLETGFWPLLTRTVGGRSGPSWLAAQKNILGKQGEAEQMRQKDQARFTNEMHKAMNALSTDKLNKLTNEVSVGEQRMLVNQMQGGDKWPGYKPPEVIKDTVKQIRGGYKDFENKMLGMTDFEKMQFIDNDKYLTAQYKNKTPEETREFFKAHLRAGGSGSTKKRFFPTDEEARDAGFEPISTNPIERFLAYSNSMSNHIAYKGMVREGIDSGYIKYYNPHTVAGAGTPDPYVKGKPPEGWSPIDGLTNAGGAQAYAPRDYAAAFNNFLGNGLGGRSSDWRNFWGGVRRVSNSFTALELGIATYHAFTTVHERVTSAWGGALSLAAAGKMELAGKRFAKSLVSPADPLIDVAGMATGSGKVGVGGRFQGLFNGTIKNGTPQEMAIVDAARAANFKPINAKHALDYEMSKAGSYYDSIVRGSFKHELVTEWKNIIGENGWKEGMMVLPRNVGRMMQTIAKPLFEFYIPRMKSAAFFENVKDWMDANPNHTTEELYAVAIKIGKSIDNRMGEMAQDNMLMHRTLRDAGTLLLRSFSFTLGGPFREVGGGTQSLARGAAQGKNRLSITSNQYDPRTAYALAFPLAVMSMSMLYQYMKTGKGPEEWRDLIYPKTGGEQPGVGKGHLVPERALLPGYHKDIMAYIFHPGQEAKNKVAGLWQAIADQIRGKKMTEVGDVPIVPSNASVGEAALERGKAFGEKALPIFIKTATQDPRLTSKISYPEQLLGFRSPGKWAADSEGQHIADEKRAQREWDFAQKRINADRRTRGLEPLPPRERNPNP